MHIFFSGIGGTGIGPLALIANQAGYEVSGSDKRDSQYISYLKKLGIDSITIGQSTELISAVHNEKPIDWFVYSSALVSDNPNHPELKFCEDHNIKTSKRDELLNQIIEEKNLKLVAVAGTHGKTTTTSMVIWLFKQLNIPISYSVGAKISFGEMGQFDPDSEYFVYECDEFDRNFLAFYPYQASISGLSWDHHEIYPTKEEYLQAFKQFIDQSKEVNIWQNDWNLLGLGDENKYLVIDSSDKQIQNIELVGKFNRLDAWLALKTVHRLINKPINDLVVLMNKFPGLSRRFEQITENLYSDYAHTPEKITGAIQTASEQARKIGQNLVVVYEPLTNRRMHHIKDLHSGLFENVNQLYWVPSYLAREDPALPVLTPNELIAALSPSEQQKAKAMKLDNQLSQAIKEHLVNGDLVLGLSGGSGGSLDEWLREQFKP